MPVTGMFPYDITELADGPIRCLFAPISQAIPNDLGDIVDQESPYAPVTGWTDFGATAGPFVAARGLTAASYNIQQTTLVVRERITESTRTVQVSVAEFKPANMKIIEQGAAIDTNAAASGVGASKSMPVGTITELDQYRMAFLGRRGKDQGIVTESADALTRGRIFGFVAYRCQLTAENVQMSFAEGDLANANVTFKVLPDPAITAAGEEQGFWVFEDGAQTLT